MNILLVHNSYQQAGGEDQVFSMEARLLEEHLHRVTLFKAHNDSIKRKNSVSLLTDTLWNRQVYGELRRLIRETRAEIMHVHNTFPLISPASYYAAHAERIPVVQTLHNYRLLCPAATLFRDHHVCESCVGKSFAWPGIVHACYRDNTSASAVAATMLATHRVLGTWKTKVSAYIALSDFARSKFIQGGLPESKIYVKPNFIQPDPGLGSGDGHFALFSGRLTQEKGILTLLEAWTKFDLPLPLEIAGDGPLASQVAEAAQTNRQILWHGWLSRDRLMERLKKAAMVIVPSTWYESFPMTIVESFALGIPVITSRLGSLISIVDHRRTGLQFNAGDSADLAAQIRWFQDHPVEAAAMRHCARSEFDSKYTSERNYKQLMQIYQAALSEDAAVQRIGSSITTLNKLG
jgi:glycosyltransferase involved in cell wall biosynthesis